ncbi:hypothetical protein ScPMuIL_013606 [Solemya velum]
MLLGFVQKKHTMSVLSPTVRELIQETGITTEIDVDSVSLSGLLNWERLRFILPEPVEESRYYRKAIGHLAPVIGRVERVLSCLTLAEFRGRYGPFTCWTGQAGAEMLEEGFRMLLGSDSCLHLTALLLVTSVIERSLGDVFLKKAAPCPSMLKDLLVTQELGEIFGDMAIQVLRLLMGPPISLNLRNVAWHGFPLPGEIPERYAYFLIVLVASLGQILEEKGIYSDSIQHREQVSFPVISQQQCQLGTAVLEVCPDIFGSSELVSHPSLPLWTTAFNFYKQKRYGHCSAILLTQLENGLRRLFCKVNGCPSRLLTAEATTLYTTFDEILDRYVERDVENRLVDKLGENMMNMLLDLLVYPEGPRVRDRLSHGEADWLTFPEHLARNVFLLSIGLAMKVSPSGIEANKEDDILKICEHAATYQSEFHPISIVKHEIKNVVQLTARLNDTIKHTPSLDSREAGDDATIWCKTGKFGEICKMTERILEVLSGSLNDFLSVHVQDFKSGFFSAMCDGSQLVDRNTGRPMKTLFRCQKQQVSDATAAVQQTLRSRQRENLKKLIECCPTLHLTVHVVLFLAMWVLYGLEAVNVGRDKLLQKSHIKFLKTMLQSCQNLKTYTGASRNKWSEAVDLGMDFLKRSIVYLSQCRTTPQVTSAGVT